MSARTAVETIQAAIENLETLKVKSTPGPWFLTYETVTHPRIWGNLDEVGDAADHVSTTARNPRDALLIVTLHRTIDTQLAILADGLIVAKHWEDILEQVSGTMRTPINHALLIARAILGEES